MPACVGRSGAVLAGTTGPLHPSHGCLNGHLPFSGRRGCIRRSEIRDEGGRWRSSGQALVSHAALDLPPQLFLETCLQESLVQPAVCLPFMNSRVVGKSALVTQAQCFTSGSCLLNFSLLNCSHPVQQPCDSVTLQAGQSNVPHSRSD